MNFLGTIDWIVVGLYFLVIAALSLYSMKKKKDSASEYFLANRNVGWFIIGASILASNIGSEHVVGLAGTAAKSGLAMGHYELHSWIILILGWVFVPFYMRSAVYTMPEFLERRYNAKTRWLLSIIQMLSYIIAKVSVTVYAGAIVITSFLGIDFWTGALILIVITGIYTILGGLRAVMYTETLQAVILLLGAIVLTITGLHAVGGWQGLVAATPKSHLNMFLPLNDPNFPWLGILFASPIVGIWYWCTDQHIVQRCLAARDETQARRGTIFAAYLKLFPVFIFMIPGIIAYVLAKSGKIYLPVTDQAFPTLVKALLPVGFRGLIAGGLLAALMSSLAAVYNACSTLFTMDIYIKIKPKAEQKELVRVGRIATAAVVILGVAWIPIMQGISGTLYQYLQSVQSYLAPPIAAVFLLGVFSKRINGKGAWAAMIGGFIIGCLRIILELLRHDLSGILYTFATINFLYFCILLFVISIIILVTVSLFTEKPTFEQLNGLTFSTTVAEDKAKSRASWNTRDLVLSLIVVVIIITAFLYFSPFGVAH
jgi:SSS family solute:Na+ symporter